jgi:hypothetical protein
MVDSDVRLERAGIVGFRAPAKNFGLARCEALVVVHTHLRLRDRFVSYLYRDWHL